METSFKSFKPIIATLVGVIMLLGAYQIGVFVGYRRAMYSYRWGQDYHRNFAGPKRGFFGDGEAIGKGFTDAHGIFGSVLQVDGATLIILDKDGTEKTIQTSSSTSIRRGNETIQASAVSTTDRVVIVGSPNEHGQIEAKLIRLFPPQPSQPQPRLPFPPTN